MCFSICDQVLYTPISFFFRTQSVRRRRHAQPLLMGIVSTVNSVPHVDPTVVAKPEEYNFSLLINSKDSTLSIQRAYAGSHTFIVVEWLLHVCPFRFGVPVQLGELVQSYWSHSWRTCSPDTGSWRQNPPGVRVYILYEAFTHYAALHL